MNIPRRPWLAAIAVSCFLFGASPARAQMTMVESGFVCILLNGDFAKQIEVGVGPDTCVYYGSNEGLKRRCNPNGPDTICDPALTFPAGIAFSTGGAFLNRMYVADFGQGDVFRSTGCAAGTMFADMFAPGSIAFPPAGSAYGDFLYACEAFDGPIYRINSTGTKVEWLEIETVYLRFGPGGAWGTGLYATDMSTPNGAAIVKISSAGAVTPFVDEFVFTEGFDWGFDGDMFATDAATGEIWRIKANGTMTLFATLPGAADVAYRPGEQALYAVSNQGGLWRITHGGPAGVDEGAARPSLAVWPNPGAGAFSLRFATAEAGLVEASVWDASGRRVRTLGRSWRAAGTHDLAWDGRSDAGTPVAAGVYFARVRSAGVTLRARVTIVR
jgi:hypothetical protein